MSKTENILLSLKYCWMLNREHIQRLHFPDKSIKAVQDILTNLKDQGLVDKLNWGNPGRQPSMWFLTDAGDRTIRRLAAYPEGRRHSRPRSVLEHDKRTLDMIVNIIEIARDTGLCGIKVFREVKLNPDPKVKKPILDALMIFEVGGDFSHKHPDLVPWSLDKPLTHESLWRVCLEADNHTEANQIIAGKAVSYQLVLRNAAWREWWVARYGWAMPYVVWVAPSDDRVASIVAHWEATWPDGQWLATSDEGLERNIWTIRENRQTFHNKPIMFFSQPTKPATTKAATAQSSQTNSVETARQQSEADRRRRQAEQDARDFALPLSQRLSQVGYYPSMTGELDEQGRPRYSNGSVSTSTPRFRPEEAEAFAAHIEQQRALHKERERQKQEHERQILEQKRQYEAKQRRLIDEKLKLQQEEARYDLIGRLIVQNRQETIQKRIRRIEMIFKSLVIVLLVISLYRIGANVYDFINISSTERVAASLHQRLEQGGGQCARTVKKGVLWLDTPTGKQGTIEANSVVIRLGETWSHWLFDANRAKVGIQRYGIIEPLGWVDELNLLRCSSSYQPVRHR